MKISIIIAAYNAERYLAEALYSAVNQGFNHNEYEILVVNDGSTDETLQIIEAYKKQYPNICIINKENGGPSSARNLALKQARGEYIYFLDADDIMAENALESLYSRAVAQSADLVIAGYDIFSKKGTSPIKRIVDMIKLDSIDRYDKRILWTFTLWNKLFKKSIIDAGNIDFPTDIGYSEDGVFVMKYVFSCGKITGLDKIVLHYRKLYSGVADSITTMVSRGKVEDYLKAHEAVYDIIIKSIEKDFPNEKIEDNKALNAYINEFYLKAVEVLINPFYQKILSVDNDTKNLIINSIKNYYGKMDAISRIRLQSTHPDILFNHLGNAEAYITAVLYGDEDGAFIPCLTSILNQNLIGIRVVMQGSCREAVMQKGLLYENVEFIDAQSENELFNSALKNAGTELIVFCSGHYAYFENAFRVAYRRYIKDNYDFLTGAVYTEGTLTTTAVSISSKAIDECITGFQLDGIIDADTLLENKFFNVEFLRGLNKDINKDIIKTCYKKGGYLYTMNKQLCFLGDEKEFIAHIGGAAGRLDKALRDEKSAILGKVKADGDIKNQACIICRADAIQDNGKLLKKRLNKKAKVFEIESTDELNSSKLLSTVAESGIIITDFVLEWLDKGKKNDNQKFILNFNTADLFDTKKALSPLYDVYDMITVSSDELVTLCAKRLGIDECKICAIGSLSNDLISSTDKAASKIIKKNKALRDKEIVLLLPGEKRIGADGFDYDEISSAMSGNQIAITKQKLNKEYPNIIELNQYSQKELMMISDIMLCDYSPAVFEYSMMNKPIVFYCPDMNINNVGYMLHYPEDLPSYLIRTADELKAFLKDKAQHIVCDKQRAFAKSYMSYCDGKAADRIAEIINNYMEV